jgi:hypothetical protein
MVTVDQILRVKSLLERGAFQSKIRRATGLSCTTVRRIADGKLDYRLGTSRFNFTSIIHNETATAERCPGCGGMVYMPCVLCTIRNAVQGPNSNVEVVVAEELHDAIESCTHVEETANTTPVEEQVWTTPAPVEELAEQRRLRLLAELDAYSQIVSARSKRAAAANTNERLAQQRAILDAKYGPVTV